MSQIAVLQNDLHKQIRDASYQTTDDILQVMDMAISGIDSRFQANEQRIAQLQKDRDYLISHLDSIHHTLALSSDENVDLSHKLSQLREWARRASKHIGLPT